MIVPGLKTKTFFVFDDKQIEAIIKEYLDLPKDTDFELAPLEEWSNDSDYTFSISEELSSWEEVYWNKYLVNDKKDKDWPGIRTVLAKMVQSKVLPKGDYIVSICY